MKRKIFDNDCSSKLDRVECVVAGCDVIMVSIWTTRRIDAILLKPGHFAD